MSARLGRALGDPTLLVAYPLERGRGYVDEQGRAVIVGRADANRVVTPIRRDGQELAVVVHDRALLKAPRLLEDVAGALTVALANAQMQGELRVRVAAVEASRRRLATAAEAERRRFGERLRGSAESVISTRPSRRSRRPATAPGRSRRSCAACARTSRRWPTGSIRPRSWTAGWTARSPCWPSSSRFPSRSSRAPAGFPAAVEGAAWFVCSEALANVAKHSAASCARVRAARRDGVVRIEISDDGRGGADPARGSGLRGLAERVEALGGRLSVADRPGGGTVVAAELPAR